MDDDTISDLEGALTMMAKVRRFSVKNLCYERRLQARKNTGNETQTLPPGGTPMDYDNAAKMRTMLFGTCVAMNFPEWYRTTFVFRDPEQELAYGLRTQKNTVKPLILCVQAYVIRYLVFDTKVRKTCPNSDELLLPPASRQKDGLASAFTDMIWKCSSNGKVPAKLCLLQRDSSVISDTNYSRDGITERVMIFEFTTKDSLLQFTKSHIHWFTSDQNPGCLLFTYSMLLTRGLEQVEEDMSDIHATLFSPNGEIRHEFIMLMLVGNATPYLFNGTIQDEVDGKYVEQRGIQVRGDIGFLHYTAKETTFQSEIGSRLKTPYCPIWLTAGGDNFGVLFNPNKELMRDYRSENRFQLFYYNGSGNQTGNTLIGLDTRVARSFYDEEETPMLENVVLTKWNEVSVQWNGVTPFI